MGLNVPFNDRPTKLPPPVSKPAIPSNYNRSSGAKECRRCHHTIAFKGDHWYADLWALGRVDDLNWNRSMSLCSLCAEMLVKLYDQFLLTEGV